MSIRSAVKKIKWLEPLRRSRAVKGSYLFLVYFVLTPPFFSRKVRVRLGPGIEFFLDYTFGLHKYENFGDRHNAGFPKWVEACRGKMVVLDVGAHIGLTAIPAARVLAPGGKVFAFEPSAANVRSLKRHCRYNACENIVIADDLVGDTEQTSVEFFECVAPDPMNAIRPLKDLERYRKVFRRQITLDAFCAKSGFAPDVVKIDVEGAEVRALRGARELLRSKRPRVFLSIHPNRIELLGDTMDELRAVIRECGYAVLSADGRPAGALEFGEYILEPSAKV